MTDKNRQTLPDQDFERILKASAADIPPADVIRGITPHRTAVNRIITGLVLTTFTLNIAGLDYIGPATCGRLQDNKEGERLLQSRLCAFLTQYRAYGGSACRKRHHLRIGF